MTHWSLELPHRKRAPIAPTKGARFVVFFLAAVSAEVIRYVCHGKIYPTPWFSLVVFSLAFNLGYHLWSMPTSFPKVCVSALYNQLTLPYFTVAVFRFVMELVPNLPNLPTHPV